VAMALVLRVAQLRGGSAERGDEDKPGRKARHRGAGRKRALSP